MSKTKLHADLIALGVSKFEGEPSLMSGSSLYASLPNATHELVEKYFGTAFSKAEQKKKYSDKEHLFMVNGVPVSLYMSYGQWRFGVHQSRVNEAVRGTLHAIQFNLLSAQS